jgi:hypothetical protein
MSVGIPTGFPLSQSGSLRSHLCVALTPARWSGSSLQTQRPQRRDDLRFQGRSPSPQLPQGRNLNIIERIFAATKASGTVPPTMIATSIRD